VASSENSPFPLSLQIILAENHAKNRSDGELYKERGKPDLPFARRERKKTKMILTSKIPNKQKIQ